jgi:hypothetical protein
VRGFASSSNFVPVIIKRLTILTVKANLCTIGPNVSAAVALLSARYLSDRFAQRALFASGALGVSLIGFVLLGSLDLVNLVEVGYFLTFLLTFGVFTPGLLTPVWRSSNMPTTTGRTAALGMTYMSQNLGGYCFVACFPEPGCTRFPTRTHNSGRLSGRLHRCRPHFASVSRSPEPQDRQWRGDARRRDGGKPSL